MSLEDAAELFIELKKFFGLQVKAPKKPFVLPGLIKLGMPSSCLHKTTTRFVSNNFGEFLHHIPHRSTDEELPLSKIQETIDLFHEHLPGTAATFGKNGQGLEYLKKA